MLIKNNKVYDVLKEVALTILPALAIAYVFVAKAWGFGYVKEVTITFMAVDFVIGAVIHLSAAEYKKSMEQLKELKEAVQEGFGNGDIDCGEDPEIMAVTDHDDDPTQLPDAKG